MKKIAVLFFAFLFSLALLPAFSEGWALSVTPTFGYSQGVLNEILYHSRDTSKKISLLEWERNVWLYGADISSSFRRFHADLSFSSAVQSCSGEMRDSDWLNTNDYSMKTTYSVGDIEAEGNIDLSLSLSFDALKTSCFSLSPVVSVQYEYDSFSRGKDAEGWYGQSDYSSDGKMHNWYDGEAKHFPTEYYWSDDKQKYVHQVLGGIDYNRHTFYSWFGLRASFLVGKFSLGIQFLVSPYTYFSAEDTHHGSSSDSVYHLIQSGSFSYYKVSSDFSYEISRIFSVTLSTEMLFGETLKGDLYSDWYLNTLQPSGGDAFAFTSKLGCRIRILN